MRNKLPMVVAAIVLAGCSTSPDYRSASRELMLLGPHVWCWASVSDSPTNSYCDLAEAPKVAEEACLARLETTGLRPSSMASAQHKIETCMRAEGWYLKPFLLAPDTYEAADCAKQYGWERCPQMPATAR